MLLWLCWQCLTNKLLRDGFYPGVVCISAAWHSGVWLWFKPSLSYSETLSQNCWHWNHCTLWVYCYCKFCCHGKGGKVTEMEENTSCWSDVRQTFYHWKQGLTLKWFGWIPAKGKVKLGRSVTVCTKESVLGPSYNWNIVLKIVKHKKAW